MLDSNVSFDLPRAVTYFSSHFKKKLYLFKSFSCDFFFPGCTKRKQMELSC